MTNRITVTIAASVLAVAVMYAIGVPSPWLIIPAVALAVGIVLLVFRR